MSTIFPREEKAEQIFDKILENPKACDRLKNTFFEAIPSAEESEGAGADSTDDYEDLDNIYTDPEVAKKFVEMTNVDCLAVAFGTTHGVYLTEPKLDLPRVARLREATNIPLVMHGGSGVSDEDYAVAIENGICKVNYYTYMNTAGGKASKEYWADDSKPLFYDSMSLVATEAIKEDVKRAIKVFQKL